MKNMEELQKRKKNRLKDYDYSQNGAYFITVCVKDKRNLLWTDVGATCGRPQLTDIALKVDKEINKISAVYENVVIDKYVIMPNHIHIIILLNGTKNGRTEFAPTISRIIKQFKGSISKQIGYSIWQQSFYDHIIRDEEDYLKIWRYTETNPLKWREDCYYEM